MIRLDYQPPRPALWRRVLARLDAWFIRAALRDLRHHRGRELSPAQRDELRRLIERLLEQHRPKGPGEKGA